MHNHFDTIADKIFQKTSFADVSLAEIASFIEKYPYAPIGHLLMARKNNSRLSDTDNVSKRATLFATDPLWIHYLLQYEPRPIPTDITTRNNSEKGKSRVSDLPAMALSSEMTDVKESAVEPLDTASSKDVKDVVSTSINIADPVSDGGAVDQGQKETDHSIEPVEEAPVSTKSAPLIPSEQPSTPEEDLVFEPYHTIDYFASQGIKLKGEDFEKDRFGKQLKSFTEWLKSLKKINPTQPIKEEDEAKTVASEIVEHATASIESDEILTEAMAEVWLKQGNKQKAIQIYQKLSLQNPSKNGYFASKISQINAL